VDATRSAGGTDGWDDERLERGLAARPGFGPVVLLASTGSTNADAADAARAGAAEGYVVVADEQTLGRGRLGRSWATPPGTGLAVSVVLRPPLPPERTGWLPLLVGVAVVDAVRRFGVPAALKWPNDVVVAGPTRDGGPGPRKLGGLLAERVHEADAVVAGIGLNIGLRAEDLPVPTATSTALEGAEVSREDLLVDLLDGLRERYTAWVAAGGDAEACGLLADYRARCLTLGAAVRAHLPGGEVVEGRAVDVDATGRLLVEDRGGVAVTLAAGDVEHLR
jgi:BirA family biotin operon repressor/biotin-[acetyl-CoA-carboxylase] ligase